MNLPLSIEIIPVSSADNRRVYRDAHYQAEVTDSQGVVSVSRRDGGHSRVKMDGTVDVTGNFSSPSVQEALAANAWVTELAREVGYARM